MQDSKAPTAPPDQPIPTECPSTTLGTPRTLDALQTRVRLALSDPGAKAEAYGRGATGVSVSSHLDGGLFVVIGGGTLEQSIACAWDAVRKHVELSRPTGAPVDQSTSFAAGRVPLAAVAGVSDPENIQLDVPESPPPADISSAILRGNYVDMWMTAALLVVLLVAAWLFGGFDMEVPR
jgi:hypothetical protein